MLFYPAALDLSARTLRFVADLIRAHRKAIGSVWRKLAPADQALLALAYLRKNETYAALAAGFQVGLATAWRYVDEVLRLHAPLAGSLDTALQRAQRKAYLILDGTLIPTDRLGGGQAGANNSGKHRREGLNVQFLTDPRGDLLWASAPLPGSLHDLTAARTHNLPTALANTGLTCYADKAYQGAGGTIHTPHKRKTGPGRKAHSDLSTQQKHHNHYQAQLRSPGERGAATLKTWRICRHARISPNRMTHVINTLLTLHHHTK